MTLKLQRSLRQLSAARDVAKLEWEVSQGDLEAVKGRVANRKRQYPRSAKCRARYR